MIRAKTDAAPLLRTFIPIKAGRKISKCPGVAFWDLDGKVKIEGDIGPVAKRIANTLLSGLSEDGGPVIEKIIFHAEGIWIVISLGIGMPVEKIIGFVEGAIAHATPAK